MAFFRELKCKEELRTIDGNVIREFELGRTLVCLLRKPTDLQLGNFKYTTSTTDALICSRVTPRIKILPH